MALIVLGVLGYAISYYKRFVREARANQSRLQAIVDTAADGIITIDSHGIIQSFNHSAERIFGWAAQEVIGQNVKLLMPDPHRSAHDGYLKHYQQTGEAKIIGTGRDVIGLTKAGQLVPIHLAIGKAALPNDTFYVGIIVDISQRKQMEKALQKSEQQFRSLISNIPGAAYRMEVGNHREIIFISEGISRLTGYQQQEFTNHNINYVDIILPEFSTPFEQFITTIISTQKQYTIEYKIRHADGHELWVWHTATYMADEDERWIDGVILNINERRLAEDQIRHSRDTAKKDAENTALFLANISHEIRTPLNAVVGFSNLLAETTLNPLQQHYMESVTSAANALLLLLNNVLDTMKLERGALELENIDFSLKELLEDIITLFRLNAQVKKIKLSLDYDSTLAIFFKGDPLRIRQIINNLLSNAIKFTEQGEVVIYTTKKQHQVHIAIKDTGIGISPASLQKIFLPFTQEDASMSRRFGGTGLGTTIAKQLTELMHGQINVESTLGKGTTFHVTLPLQEGSPIPPTNKQVEHQLPPLAILAVDDVSHNLELLKIILEQQGHTITTATNGLEAVATFKNQPFDLVLMDLQMPELDGLEATKVIRQYEKQQGLSPTPILALTANVLSRERQAARNVGMNGFVKKPIDKQELMKAMISACQLTTTHLIETETIVDNLPTEVLIDWNKGINLWNDKTYLTDAIYNFLTTTNQELNTFLVDQQHLTDFFMLVHKIRGAAGNLCLPKLYQTSSLIEQYKNSTDLSVIADELTKLQEVTQLTLEEVAPLHSPLITIADQQAFHINDDQDKILISQVAEELKQGQMNEEHLQSLYKLLAHHQQQDTINTLKKQLANFDLTLASALLEKLI